MNSYVAFGNITNNLISDNAYVLITSVGEYLGSLLFVFMLIGSISNFVLRKSKAYTSKPFGWIVLSIAISLLISLFVSYGIQYGLFYATNKQINQIDAFELCQLNFNPALVISSMLKATNNSSNYIPIANGVIYLIFEFIGFLTGSLLAYLFYKRLMINESYVTIQSCFYTSPSVNNKLANSFNEFFATFMFVVAIIGVSVAISNDMYYIKLILISMIVMGIGYGLGGVTGYALNPFRDLCPRIMYWIIYGKRDKTINWRYCLIPLLSPILGSIVAYLIMPGWLY